MQLKTNRVRNSVQRVESMGAKSSINVQKPKIKEAKKLNPNARKRYAIFFKFFFCIVIEMCGRKAICYVLLH